VVRGARRHRPTGRAGDGRCLTGRPGQYPCRRQVGHLLTVAWPEPILRRHLRRDNGIRRQRGAE
jgi:hypothetical protein